MFCNAAALRENLAEARAYECAVRVYAEERCEIDLWDALSRLNYLPDEIQWHVDHRGGRVPSNVLFHAIVNGEVRRPFTIAPNVTRRRTRKPRAKAARAETRRSPHAVVDHDQGGRHLGLGRHARR